MNWCDSLAGIEPTFADWDEQAYGGYREPTNQGWLTREDILNCRLPSLDQFSICAELRELIELAATNERELQRLEIVEEHKAQGFNEFSLLGRLIEVAYGPLSGRPECSDKVRSMISIAADQSMCAIFFLKFKYNRARPYTFLPLMPMEVVRTRLPFLPRHASYPSGHSTLAHLGAFLLANRVPSKREALVKAAFEIAKRREIAGLHFRSDTFAGVLLAYQLASVFLSNPNFANEFSVCG